MERRRGEFGFNIFIFSTYSCWILCDLFIIKIAVRNAISESLEDIREIISKTINKGRYEYDGKN